MCNNNVNAPSKTSAAVNPTDTFKDTAHAVLISSIVSMPPMWRVSEAVVCNRERTVSKNDLQARECKVLLKGVRFDLRMR